MPERSLTTPIMVWLAREGFAEAGQRCHRALSCLDSARSVGVTGGEFDHPGQALFGVAELQIGGSGQCA